MGVKKRKMHWSWWVLMGCLALCCIGGLVVFVMMTLSFTPIGQKAPPKEDVIAIDAGETPVAVTEIGLSGTVLIDEGTKLKMIDTVTGKSKSFSGFRREETINSIAGPNSNGLAILLVGTFSRHRLLLLNLETMQDKTLTERRGAAYSGETVGESPAIAKDSNYALYFRRKGYIQLRDPSAYMPRGELWRINLDTGHEELISKKALDSESAISPDGQTIWFCTWSDRKEVLALPGGDRLPNSGGDAIAVSQWSAGALKLIAHGWGVAQFHSGGLMIYGNGHPGREYSFADEKFYEPPLPDYMYDFKYAAENGVYVCKAMQISVDDVQFTTNNGMPGPRSMNRIVAVDPETLHVAELYPAIDPRRAWSYGTWPRYKQFGPVQ